MAKVHKTLRVEEDIARRVSEAKRDGEKESEAYARVLLAGLESIEAGGKPAQEADTADQEAQEPPAAMVSVLIEQIAQKDAQLKAQGEQLTRALEQSAEITAALRSEQETTKAAQVLQGMAQAGRIEAPKEEQAQEPGKEEKRGFFARIFNL